MEQKAFAGAITTGVPNTLWRIRRYVQCSLGPFNNHFFNKKIWCIVAVVSFYQKMSEAKKTSLNTFTSLHVPDFNYFTKKIHFFDIIWIIIFFFCVFKVFYGQKLFISVK